VTVRPVTAFRLDEAGIGAFRYLVRFARGRAKSRGSRFTPGGYEAMAHLGNHYAEKILGAVEEVYGDGPTSIPAPATHPYRVL
jgi:hypothetical protein